MQQRCDVRLRPPLPRPGKILACIANYWEHAQREPRPLNMFMKNPDAVIGPGDTIMLPEYTVPWAFMHEAELALVMKGPAKMVKQKDWKSAVFGYTSTPEWTTLVTWIAYVAGVLTVYLQPMKPQTPAPVSSSLPVTGA